MTFAWALRFLAMPTPSGELHCPAMLHFRSLRSGSSGNGQLLVAGRDALLVDLGMPAGTALRPVLAELRQRGVRLLGALVTHEHGDHFAVGALRAMAALKLPVYAPRSAIGFAERCPELGVHSGRPRFIAVDDGEAWERQVRLGPFTVRPVEVEHHATGTCCAYAVWAEVAGGIVRAVLATDLCHPRGLPAHLVDADLVYLESNHDPELLRLRPNPASRFHLANEACASLLAEARARSARPFQHVCLGHLSELRNSPTLAKETLAAVLSRHGQPLDFPVSTAPRYHAGLTVTVRPT